ncbi:hypothetical protein TanjilG_11853 [Lupinus angustifolius]|uniref:Uncharacterized protein n=2 Tax=Lupinus angustifolius TaxID=3871 RepID=A0A1J7H4Q5_LUPAN|nr:hypothetical protein TanjilG_11853 [Lupinus angustifolius]
MQSGEYESVNQVQSLSSADGRGKHRIQAELKRVEQEAKFFEEELENLEKMEGASVLCKE